MSHIHNPDRSYLTPPPTGINLNWDNTLLYFGSSATWVDVDGHVGPALLLLKIVGQNDGTTAAIYFCKGGTAPTGVNGSCVVGALGSNVADHVSYCLVPTDPSGVFRIKTSHAAANISVYRYAYWKCAMPRTYFNTSSPPAAFADLSIGVDNALAILRLTGASNLGQCHFRINGDDSLVSQAAGYDLGAFLSKGADVDAYIAMLTGDDGIVEWYTGLSAECSVVLEAYVPLSDNVSEQIYDGATPAAWTDLSSSYGHSLLYCKVSGDNAGSWSKSRPNGQAEEMADANLGITGLWAEANKRGYAFIINDLTGISEWINIGGVHNQTITKLAAFK